MLVRSKQKQDCPLYNCLNGTTYNIQNISALTANQGTNTLAFSYAELTFVGVRHLFPPQTIPFLSTLSDNTFWYEIEDYAEEYEEVLKSRYETLTIVGVRCSLQHANYQYIMAN